MLIGVAFALGGFVAAVLPTEGEYAQATDHLLPDADSISYVTVLSRARPSDRHMRLTLVRLLAALGDHAGALSALGAADDGAEPNGDAANLRFDLLLAKARSIPEGERARAAAFGDVVSALARLARFPQNADRLRALAQSALELERPHLAAEYYLRLAVLVQDEERVAALADAGRWMRAAGDGAAAVECFGRAANLEPDRDQSRALAMRALETLVATNRPIEAAALAASYVFASPRDPAVIARASDSAAAVNRADDARTFGRMLLSLSPDDPTLLSKQVRLELAAGSPAAALPSGAGAAASGRAAATPACRGGFRLERGKTAGRPE